MLAAPSPWQFLFTTMSLVQLDEISLQFGEQVLLREASMNIESGERVCLIGRNGVGKTTLFKIIAGKLEPDSGDIRYSAGLGISQLHQSLPEARDHTVRFVVSEGLASVRLLADEYKQRSANAHQKNELRALEKLHQQIDARGGWNTDQQIDRIITELDLPADKKLNELSGGWRRRVALARALVSQPDLLLLDEPTNHLDLATINWLEDRVYNWQGAILFITHDRSFLQRLATRIIELDRTRLRSWDCDYRTYLRRREEAHKAEHEEEARFDKKLAEEEVWVRKGVKARRTRNQGRVKTLETMREEASGRIKRERGAHITIDKAEDSGRKVVRMRNVSYDYGEEPVIKSITLTIQRGDRIGLVGNNGVGKSTLLRLLLGELEPQQGTIKIGTNLETAYFDQLRRELDPDKTVAEIVGDGRDYITINGKQRHVVGYLRGFLFSAKRAMSPIRILSGGERNRVLLARLFTRPSNLLVLDEPTNDLDVETLEVLEQQLVDYPGTLIVVSHDRTFLDNVVGSILVFEDDGQVKQYFGGYSDWLKRGHHLAEMDDASNSARKTRRIEERARRKQQPQKISYKEQRELSALPGELEQLEANIAQLEMRCATEGFYSLPYEETQPVIDSLEQQKALIERRTERWLQLEEMQQNFLRAKSADS